MEGEISLSGTSPDLGDFKIRIVDRKYTLKSYSYCPSNTYIDPDNKAVLHGSFEEDFHETIGRTPYLAINVDDDNVWKAKGSSLSFKLDAC